ncbi:hypothetical protein ACFSUI_15900 [Ralstonia solanacearum]
MLGAAPSSPPRSNVSLSSNNSSDGDSANVPGAGKTNPILDEPRVGYGEKGQGSGNKVDQTPNRKVMDGEGNPIPIYADKKDGPVAVQEFPSVPKAHGFSDIVDNYADAAKQTMLSNGAKLYQLEGSLNGVAGRYEWIVDPRLGGVTHRMFVPGGKINGVPSKP